MFLSIVGAEAGHMALRSLASGGVYVCGGIPPRVRPRGGGGASGVGWGSIIHGLQTLAAPWPPAHHPCPSNHPSQSNPR